MTLTALVEDRANPDNPALSAITGFALHAALEDTSILYDFGDSGALMPNADALGIDLADVDTAVLSHGHHHHSGGLDAFLERNTKAAVLHGRGAFLPRWRIKGGPARDVGVSLNLSGDVVHRLQAVDSLDNRGSFVILPAAPGFQGRPADNTSLLAGPRGSRLPDDFTDELTLMLPSESGLVVVTGCAHRGILNIADQIAAYFADQKVAALIGGFHLLDEQESEDDLRRLAGKLAGILPEARIIAGHCTESRAVDVFGDIFGERFSTLCVGRRISFNSVPNLVETS